VEKLIYLFFDTDEFELKPILELQEIWLGQAVLNEIVLLVGNDIMDKNDEAFRKLSDM
jgi:hypothetical protein